MEEPDRSAGEPLPSGARSADVPASQAGDQDFHDLAAAAAEIAGTPLGAVALLRGRQQWLRGRAGTGRRTAPSDGSLCQAVVARGTDIEFADASTEPLVSGDPLWRELPAAGRCAGFALRLRSGAIVGALIVMEGARGALTASQRRLLRVLARQVVAQLELRELRLGPRPSEPALPAERDLSAALLEALHDGYAYLERGRIVAVNDVFCSMTGHARDELIGQSAAYPFRMRPGADTDPALLRKMINNKSGHVELPVQRPDGTRIDVSVQVRPVRRAERRVSGYVALIRDITDRKAHERRLLHRAEHDGLTGLFNRAAFHRQLADRVAAAHGRGAALSLAIIDLDRFKSVNDLFGHLAGDAVLAEFADRLRGKARGEDAIGRLGGEEFGWVMSDTGREEAVAALTRTLDAVRRHPFPHGEPLTFSAGVAQLRRTCGVERSPETADSLLQRADQLLYEAKARGRNRVMAVPLQRTASMSGSRA